MKRNLILLLMLIIISESRAQELSGIVKYRTVVNLTAQNLELNDSNISLERKRQLEKQIEKLKEVYERTFVLTFNKIESIYVEEEKLDLKNSTGFAWPFKDFYKNFREQIYIEKRDLGKIFLEKDNLPIFDWQLVDETKIIGKYTCFKAILIKEEDVAIPRKKKDGSFEHEIIKQKVTTSAWYCPQLPVMNGPYIYGNLPGLILEVGNDSKDTPLALMCIEITLNPKNGVKIRRPEGKKYYTKQELDAELKKQIKGG